ncbi:MAG: CheR family methyltransferase [Myxococcota bacterium]
MSETPGSNSPVSFATPFPIVGIASSAGEIKALQDIVRRLPIERTLAYFIIENPSPKMSPTSAEEIQTWTLLEVTHAVDGTMVVPGVIYVLPHSKRVRFIGQRLTLSERVVGSPQPVDLFFQCLADAQGERAIAVVLSGRGGEETRGVTRIRRHGGVVLVQDPLTAESTGMPRRTIEAGEADFVLSPGALVQKMVGLAPRPVDESERAVQGIIASVADVSGIKFSLYKESPLARRIYRRMRLADLSKVERYASRLQEDTAELSALTLDFLTGTTDFFRDQEAWHWLSEHVLPEYRRVEQARRIWILGCSTGQEAYSLAIALLEATEGNLSRGRSLLRLFATDADRGAIERAKLGCFTDSDIESVPQAYRSKYFERTATEWRIRTFVRNMITFGVHDVLTDPPYSNLDLVVCRNLLMYLRPGAQRSVVRRLSFGLQTKGGTLFLGPGETVGDQLGRFERLNLKWKFFRAVQQIP